MFTGWTILGKVVYYYLFFFQLFSVVYVIIVSHNFLDILCDSCIFGNVVNSASFSILYICLHLFSASLLLVFFVLMEYQTVLSSTTRLTPIMPITTARVMSVSIATSALWCLLDNNWQRSLSDQNLNQYSVQSFCLNSGWFIKGKILCVLQSFPRVNKDKPSQRLASRWFKKKKKDTKSFLLYSNGRMFVCSYLMWVNVSGSQSGGLHPASDGPHCSLRTSLCVIETC